MNGEKVYIAPNLHVPNKPIVITEKVCDGCNRCVEVCPADILAPNPKKRKAPLILHPDECQHCGACVLHCHLSEIGAIIFMSPMTWGVRWKRKDTGEHFRLGMPNPPPANPRPPIP